MNIQYICKSRSSPPGRRRRAAIVVVLVYGIAGKSANDTESARTGFGSSEIVTTRVMASRARMSMIPARPFAFAVAATSAHLIVI